MTAVAAADAAYAAAYVAANVAAATAAAKKQVFTIAAAILDEAIAIGKHAEPTETALVVSRMAAIRERAVA